MDKAEIFKGCDFHVQQGSYHYNCHGCLTQAVGRLTDHAIGLEQVIETWSKNFNELSNQHDEMIKAMTSLVNQFTTITTYLENKKIKKGARQGYFRRIYG